MDNLDNSRAGKAKNRFSVVTSDELGEWIRQKAQTGELSEAAFIRNTLAKIRAEEEVHPNQ
jgi:hypothetical protein